MFLAVSDIDDLDWGKLLLVIYINGGWEHTIYESNKIFTEHVMIWANVKLVARRNH